MTQKYLVNMPSRLPQSFMNNIFENNIESLFSDIDKILRTSFSELTHDDEFLKKSVSSGYPKANIYSYDDKLVMELGIPGLTKEDIKIKINETEGTITISGKKINNEERSDKNCLLRELKYSSFNRVFPFNPETMDFSKSNATFENGILKIELPRIEKIEKKEVLKELEIK